MIIYFKRGMRQRRSKRPEDGLKHVRTTGFMALSALVILFSAYHFLDAFRDVTGMIWGDAGDGFFNLWILRHVSDIVLSRPDTLADARIFWPDNAKSFFWSDNLIAYAPLFALSRWFAESDLDAFRLTGIFLFVIHYISLLFLFYQAFAVLLASRPGVRPVVWFVPLMAGAAQCSSTVLLNHHLHIQNFSVSGLFLLMGSILAFRRSNSPRWLSLIALALVLLLYSAPYFAIGGTLLTLIWLLMLWIEHPSKMKEFVFQNMWIGFLAAAAALPIILAYLQADGRTGFSAAAIRSNAIKWSDLFIPNLGAFSTWFPALDVMKSRPDYERLAWIGPGLLLLIAWIVLKTSLALKTRITFRPLKTGEWFIIFSLLLITLKIRDIRPWTAWYGILFIAFIYFQVTRMFTKLYRGQPVKISMYFLFMATVIFYGIALGPRGYYAKEMANPSVWGFFALWMPGFDSMRAIGRYAYPGQVALMTLAFMLTVYVGAFMTARGKLSLVLFGVFCLALQVWDVHAIRPPQQRHKLKDITPDSDERAFFGSIEGSVLVIPGNPFPLNTRHMLFFQTFQQIQLMNGYSGKSTPRWDTVMKLEADFGPVSREQINRALEDGVDYIAIRIDRIPGPETLRDGDRLPETMFRNNRWAVYRAASFTP